MGRKQTLSALTLSCPRPSSCPCKAHTPHKAVFSLCPLTVSPRWTTVPEALTTPPTHPSQYVGSTGREGASRTRSSQAGWRGRPGWEEVGRRKREGWGLRPMTKGETHYSGCPDRGWPAWRGQGPPGRRWRPCTGPSLQTATVARTESSEPVRQQPARVSLEATCCRPSCNCGLGLA